MRSDIVKTLSNVLALASAGAALGNVVDRLAGKGNDATEAGAVLGTVLGILGQVQTQVRR